MDPLERDAPFIKARGWSEKEGKMLPIKTIEADHMFVPETGNYFLGKISATLINGEIVKYRDGLPSIMYFSGRWDKNGKEIYEGDIVRYDRGSLNGNPDYQYYEVYYGIDDPSCSCCYTPHPGFFMKEFGKNKDEDSCWWDDNVEIVGNVYKKPELSSQPVNLKQ